MTMPRATIGRVLPRRPSRRAAAGARMYAAALAIWMGCIGEAFGGLVPPDATVILLSGLPGDLESETSYNQQLEGWLKLLTSQSRRILVLCDNPDTLNSRAPGKLAARKGDWLNFLQLTAKLNSL